MVHYFTSAATNYLPKARVLARSVAEHDPDGVFHLLLCDDPPPGFDLAQEPFDAVIRLEDLGIPDLPSWRFKHTVVELCTAAKGPALHRLLTRDDAEMVIYLDPDSVVLAPLDGLHDDVRGRSVALTPHHTEPESTPERIERIEINSLMYGVFNLGFLGVSPTEEGLAFARWWRDRLLAYCYDEKERGLFTDQRWCDLVPCLFRDVAILRSPAYNLCHWNLSGHTVERGDDARLTVDGEPVVFYHFSGFDWGLDEDRLRVRGEGAAALLELREWYTTQLEAAGHRELGGTPPAHARYANGEPVTAAQRIYYRSRPDLEQRFPDPFAVPADGGFLGYYRRHAPGRRHPDLERQGLTAPDLTRLLEAVYGSWSWRIGQAVTWPARALRRLLS